MTNFFFPQKGLRHERLAESSWQDTWFDPFHFGRPFFRASLSHNTADAAINLRLLLYHIFFDDSVGYGNLSTEEKTSRHPRDARKICFVSSEDFSRCFGATYRRGLIFRRLFSCRPHSVTPCFGGATLCGVEKQRHNCGENCAGNKLKIMWRSCDVSQINYEPKQPPPFLWSPKPRWGKVGNQTASKFQRYQTFYILSLLP
jgi:hypothetical protein